MTFCGQLSSFSPHFCLSTCSRPGMSKPSFPNKHFNYIFRHFQFQVDDIDCVSISCSPVPRAHQYLPMSLSFLSKASSILLPALSSYNLTSVSLLPMYSNLFLPSSGLSSVKGQNILECLSRYLNLTCLNSTKQSWQMKESGHCFSFQCTSVFQKICK